MNTWLIVAGVAALAVAVYVVVRYRTRGRTKSTKDIYPLW